MQRFPKIGYDFEIETKCGKVWLRIADTEWDTAGPVEIIDAIGCGLDDLAEYFERYGIGMYGEAISLDSPVLIPQDVYHILLMQDKTHHSDLLKSQKMICGFVPDEAWLRFNDENAMLMDDVIDGGED